MDHAPAEPPRKIVDIAWQCLKLFKECQTLDGKLAALRHHQQRYWTWLNSLKVFAEPHINLDAQLRDPKYDALRRPILRLLDVLVESLNLALRLVNDIANALPERDVHIVTDPLRTPLSAVEGSLQRLDRIAVVILRATENSLAKRIQIHAGRTRDENYEKQVDLVLSFRFGECLPEALRNILRDSIVYRFYRIQYERSHRVPEASTLTAATELPITPEPSRPQPSRIPASTDAGQNKKAPDQNPAPRSEAKTTPLTVDEEVVQNELRQGLSLPPSHKEHDTMSQSETGNAMYPPPPEISDGSTTAQCPICLKRFATHVFQGHRWRAHVDADLQPYLCISEICSNKLHFFASKSLWVAHMHKMHTKLWMKDLHCDRVWKCPLPHDDHTAFGTEDELTKHMLRQHTEYEPSILRSMARGGAVTRPRRIDVCPICGDEHHPQRRLQEQHIDEDIESEADEADLAKSIHSTSKPRVRFNVGHEGDLQATEIPIPNLSTNSPMEITHKRMEGYISKHLKALALYFARPLFASDDHDERSGAAIARSADGLASVDLTSFQDPPAPHDSPPLRPLSSSPALLPADATDTLRYSLLEYRGLLGDRMPGSESCRNWLTYRGPQQYQLFMNENIESEFTFADWALSHHAVQPYLDHLMTDRSWNSTVTTTLRIEERAWMDEVCAESRSRALHKDVELWRGLSPKIAHIVAIDILLASECCSRLNMDCDISEGAHLHRHMQETLSLIEANLRPIASKNGLQSASHMSPISSHCEKLKLCAIDLSLLISKSRPYWKEHSVRLGLDEMQHHSQIQGDREHLEQPFTGQPQAGSNQASRSASFDYQRASVSPAQTPLMTPALAGGLDQPSYFTLNRESRHVEDQEVTEQLSQIQAELASLQKKVVFLIRLVLLELESKYTFTVDDLDWRGFPRVSRILEALLAPETTFPFSSVLSDCILYIVSNRRVRSPRTRPMGAVAVLEFIKMRLRTTRQVYQDQYERIPHAYPGTCDWIFRHRDFKRWLEGENSEFCIIGKPGSGKSTMMKFLINRLAGNKESLILHGFLSTFGTDEQSSLVGLAKALTCQLLERLPEAARSLFPCSFDSSGEWMHTFPTATQSIAALERVLDGSFASSNLRKPIICIDGLDECKNGLERLENLLASTVISRQSRAPLKPQLIVSSRQRKVFSAFHFGATLFLEDHSTNDIKTYVRSAMISERLLPEQAEALAGQVEARAYGIFLWASLMCRQILARLQEGDDSFSRLTLLLDEVPVEIQYLYVDMLKRMRPADYGFSHTIFAMLCASELFSGPVDFTSPSSTMPLTLFDLSSVLTNIVIKSDTDVRTCEVRALTKEEAAADLDRARDLLQGSLGDIFKVIGSPDGLRENCEVSYLHFTAKDSLHRQFGPHPEKAGARFLLYASIVRIKKYSPDLENASEFALLDRAVVMAEYLWRADTSLTQDSILLDELVKLLDDLPLHSPRANLLEWDIAHLRNRLRLLADRVTAGDHIFYS